MILTIMMLPINSVDFDGSDGLAIPLGPIIPNDSDDDLISEQIVDLFGLSTSFVVSSFLF